MVGEIERKKVLFENIQGLRGIAALMVCTFHFRFVLPEPMATILFGNGYIGVQLFFMISGFIMVHTTSKIKTNFNKESLKFIINRIFRVAPLYYISTFLLIADDINDGYLINHTSYLIKSLLFIPSFETIHGPDYGMPVVNVGWTLNYEMIFYFLFAISLLFKKVRYYFLFFIFIILIILLPSLLGDGLTTDYNVWHPYTLYWLNVFTNPIWIHFVFGVTLGLIIPKLKFKAKLTKTIFYISIVTFLFYYTGFAGLEVNALNDLLFCGLLFVGFLINDFSDGGIKAPVFLTKLGDMSYSLYLFHHLSLAYFQFVCYKLDLRPFTESAHSFIPSLVITLIVCWYIYLFVEKNLNIALKRLTSNLF